MLKKLDHLKDAQDYIIKGALLSPFNYICFDVEIILLIYSFNKCLCSHL